MATNDIRSNLKQILIFSANISTSITSAGAILDTADFELGLMFALMATTLSSGTFDLLIEESSDSNMAGSVVVSGDKLIGALPSIDGVITAGDQMATVGVISTQRYVRASIVSTGASGTNQLVLISTEKAETMPVP